MWCVCVSVCVFGNFLSCRCSCLFIWYDLLDEQDMVSEPTSRKKDSNENKRSKNDDILKQPPIADKEYIVFRFREDGGIDLAEEMSHIHRNHKVF